MEQLREHVSEVCRRGNFIGRARGVWKRGARDTSYLQRSPEGCPKTGCKVDDRGFFNQPHLRPRLMRLVDEMLCLMYEVAIF